MFRSLLYVTAIQKMKSTMTHRFNSDNNGHTTTENRLDSDQLVLITQLIHIKKKKKKNMKQHKKINKKKSRKDSHQKTV